MYFFDAISLLFASFPPSVSDNKTVLCLKHFRACSPSSAGLHSNTAPSHQSGRGQSHLSAQPRTERSHNDDGPRPGCRGKKSRSGVSTSPTSRTGLFDGSLGRNAGRAARLGGQAQPPQAAVVRRNAAATFVLTLLRLGWSAQSARHLTTHDGTKIDLLAVAPETGGAPGGTFSGSQYREQFAHGIFTDPAAILPKGSPERACPVLWHNRPPDGLLEGHIFTDGSSSGSSALRRAGWAVVAVDDVGRMGLCRATFCQGRLLEMARTMQQPWQGTPLWIPSRCTSTAKVPSRQSMGHSAKFWAPGAVEHTSGTGFWFPTTRSGQSRSRATPRSATWRRSALPTCSKGETTMQTPLPRKEQTHRSLLFGSPRQSLLVSPWPSKRRGGQQSPRFAQVQGLERHQGCRSETTGKATASKTQAHEAGERCGGFRSGVRLAFSHRSLTLFARQSSRPSHVQRAQLAVGTSFRFWGRALDRAIIFCAECGPVFWERADALCRSCSELPGGRTSQLRKLRSGLFPNKRYPGWTVEHVRRPTLDEATPLVAQVESCEAGLGRTVMGPTTPKTQRAAPQAAALAHWERAAEAAMNEDLALRLCDQGRPGLLAAFGLNDQLVSKLAFKAGGSCAHKTD